MLGKVSSFPRVEDTDSCTLKVGYIPGRDLYRDFDRLQKTAKFSQELFDQMKELYAHWVSQSVVSCKPISYCRFKRIDVYVL